VKVDLPAMKFEGEAADIGAYELGVERALGDLPE
jgi:hypothetical protein